MQPTKPPDIDAAYLVGWITRYIMYFICWLIIFCAAIFFRMVAKTEPVAEPMPIIKQGFTLLFSTTLMGFVAGYCIKKWDWDPFLMCFVAACMGMGADKVSQWMANLWESSTGFISFSTRLSRIVSAMYKAYRSVTSDMDSDTKPPMEP